MNHAILAITLVSLAQIASAQDSTVEPVPRVDDTPPTTTPELRPAARPEGLSDAQRAVSAAREAAFRDWLGAFRGRALTQGISSDTFDTAMADVEYLDEVIARDRNQAEFTKPIWEYLDSVVSDARVENGRQALETHARILEAIETRYGVEQGIVAAIWGMESAYGEYRGDIPIVSALATLAHDGRRGAFFEAQLVAALKILQSGDVTSGQMTGSWAGAMGHTQFIPTSFIAYAVDFTGDGKRDIWGENPADALASTAAYLANFGWVAGQPWGVEVQLPDGFDYLQSNKSIQKTPAEWAALGVTGTDGEPVGDYGPASILLPAGADGAAFMTFANFDVIARYNTADAYVIGVGHLSDRLAGGDPLVADWPRDNRALTADERRELQRRLTAVGFDTRGVDGKIGPNTLAAIRSYQRESGAVPDGYASLNLLRSLRDGT